jgi:SAM-dependent methyltransferase
MGNNGWDGDLEDRRPIEARQMHRLLRAYVESGDIDPKAPTLALFAGAYDRAVLESLGFTDVNYGNVTMDGSGLADGEAAVLNAASLPLPGDSYDLVLAHAGIHHCSRPHAAVCEMYRVTRRHAIFFENQDSLLTRAAARVGLMPIIEAAAVEAHDFHSGGVDGTGIPNYIYRWSRREVEKLIWSLDPPEPPDVRVWTEWDIDFERLKRRLRRSPVRYVPAALVSGALRGAQRILNSVVPSQGNLFAAVIRKREPTRAGDGPSTAQPPADARAVSRSRP